MTMYTVYPGRAVDYCSTVVQNGDKEEEVGEEGGKARSCGREQAES
jgi:hypothetical protein